MGKGLFDYAAAHGCADDPQHEPIEAPAPVVLDAEERRAIVESVQLRMDQISDHLEQGRPAEIILYRAIECIALLTGDSDWEEHAIAELDKTYEKINQQALYIDQQEAARAAALDRAQDFRKKAKKHLAAVAREAEAVSQAAYKAIAAIQTNELQESTEQNAD